MSPKLSNFSVFLSQFVGNMARDCIPLEQYYCASRMLHMFWHGVWECRIFRDHIIIVLAVTQTSFLSGHRNILVNKKHCTTWTLHMLLMKKLVREILFKGSNAGAWCSRCLISMGNSTQLVFSFFPACTYWVSMLPTLCPFIYIRLNLSEEHGSQVFIGCC